MEKKLVLASNNRKKMIEMNRLLAPLGVDVIAQGSLGVQAAEEPFHTFVENSLAKARHAAKCTGLAAIADDSGICVDALKGRPGVLSARYAGEPSNDAANNAKLLADLKGKTERRAHYTCVLVAVRCAEDPEPLIAEGYWYGEVIEEARGEGGFGYDPYFFLPEFSKTAAELSSEEKNAISHRGQAMVKLAQLINERWNW